MSVCGGGSAEASLQSACRRLIGMYHVEGWWPARTRFEVLVGAVLVQNTRWVNVAAAIRTLRRARSLSPGVIATSKPADLAALIRPAGCQTVKARRLRAMAEWVEGAGGLRSLSALDTGKLHSELPTVHGVGHETADAILCFGFGRPRFVADKYARSWIARMGLAPPRETADYEACRNYVEQGLRGTTVDLGDLHAAIVLHAQSICSARPSCADCPLGGTCRHAQSGGC